MLKKSEIKKELKRVKIILKELEKENPDVIREPSEIIEELKWAEKKAREFKKLSSILEDSYEQLMCERLLVETSGYVEALSWLSKRIKKNKPEIKKERKHAYKILFDISVMEKQDVTVSSLRKLSTWEHRLFQANGYAEGLNWALGHKPYIRIYEDKYYKK
jgi:hypothetical protein